MTVVVPAYTLFFLLSMGVIIPLFVMTSPILVSSQGGRNFVYRSIPLVYQVYIVLVWFNLSLAIRRFSIYYKSVGFRALVVHHTTLFLNYLLQHHPKLVLFFLSGAWVRPS